MKKKLKVEGELQRLRAFVEARLADLAAEIKRLKAQIGGTARPHHAPAPAPAAPPPAPPAKASVAARAKRQPASTKKKAAGAKHKIARNPGALADALKAHKHHKELVRVGKQRDQLLRSLVPLYVARSLSGVDVNSGAISSFWKAQGVSYAGPNAAKALRAHVGYATKSGRGWAITPTGVKYVEAALAKDVAA